MAASIFWCEDNGAAAGSPAHGTSTTTGIGQVNWKNVDDTASLYSSNPITAGNNSFGKYQFVLFSGAFNQISNATFQHTSGSFVQPGFILIATGLSGYVQPATTAFGGSPPDITATGLVTTGLAVKFAVSQVGANGTPAPSPFSGSAATLSTTGCTFYLVTQLQTTAAAAPGDTPTITVTLKYDEN